MKAKINGIEYEGTFEEISRLTSVNNLKAKKYPETLWEDIFKKAKEIFLRENIELTPALRQARKELGLGTDSAQVGGKELTKFKDYLLNEMKKPSHENFKKSKEIVEFIPRTVTHDKNERFEEVYHYMMKTGQPVTTALKLINGYAGGKVIKKFKTWLVDNNKTTTKTYNKDNTEIFQRAHSIYKSDKKQGATSALKLITGKDNNYQLKKFKEYLKQQGETELRLKSKGWKKPMSEEDKRMMSDIGKKGVELFKQGMTRQDAMRQAQTMIRKKPNLPAEAYSYEGAAYHKATATTPLSFPKFETVDDKFHTILEGILKNFYQHNGSLSYTSDAYSLGIADREEWKQFIEELTARNEAVTKYLNIKGKYTVAYNMAQFKRI